LTFTFAAGAALLALAVVAGRLRPAALAHSPV
jgi:hypothetical protein